MNVACCFLRLKKILIKFIEDLSFRVKVDKIRQFEIIDAFDEN